MSPRRRFAPYEEPLFVEQAVAPPRDWRLVLRLGAAGLVILQAITACVLILAFHESHRRAALRDVAALGYVKSFMTYFASPDPFNSNDYVDHVLSQATGEFEKDYRERANQIVLKVAMAAPTTGTVLDAGVERWNDDDSANVLVAVSVTTKPPDKPIIENTYRWVITAKQEGSQWKVSGLTQVI